MNGKALKKGEWTILQEGDAIGLRNPHGNAAGGEYKVQSWSGEEKGFFCLAFTFFFSNSLKRLFGRFLPKIPKSSESSTPAGGLPGCHCAGERRHGPRGAAGEGGASRDGARARGGQGAEAEAAGAPGEDGSHGRGSQGLG